MVILIRNESDLKLRTYGRAIACSQINSLSITKAIKMSKNQCFKSIIFTYYRAVKPRFLRCDEFVTSTSIFRFIG